MSYLVLEEVGHRVASRTRNRTSYWRRPRNLNNMNLRAHKGKAPRFKIHRFVVLGGGTGNTKSGSGTGRRGKAFEG